MDAKTMKGTNGKSMGPFGDIGMKTEDGKKEKRNKEVHKSGEREGNPSIVKSKKLDKQTSQDRLRRHENSRKIQEYERKEQERRERYEREAAEEERNRREAEIQRWERERSRNRSNNGRSLSRHKPRRPPPGYKDPHEVCKQVLPTKVKEKKRQEIKALMNCIAFTPSQTDIRGAPEEDQIPPKENNQPVIEEIDNSSGSDSTSITDVTPRSSSSGCSSMSKQSMCADKTENANPKKSKEATKSMRQTEGEINKMAANTFQGEEREQTKRETQLETDTRNLTEVELEEIKYMQDAFEDLDLDEETSDFASSIISGLSEERRAKCNRKNMTFTNEQLREIERVNLILLKKIMNHRKPRPKPSTYQPLANRKTSAAINRAKMEEKIERENKILLKKLQSAKGTTGTLSRKNSQSKCY